MGIYQELGVRPFINARAPYTRFGGATLPPEVSAAMVEASKLGVGLAAMQAKVGEAVARMTNNEAAYVSCGAASGVTLAVAACMTGTDEALAERLPDTAEMKGRVIMHACDLGTECDVGVRNSGAKIVAVGNRNGACERELRAALAESNVAAMVILLGAAPGKLPIVRLVEIAHSFSVPVLIDAAGCVPPRENLWESTRDGGADAAIFSGGKELRGPQSTGLVLGTRAIVEGCRFHGVPNSRIGRGMKVDKESLAGIYAAVKLFLSLDETDEDARHAAQADYIAAQLHDVETCAIVRHGAHRLQLQYDPAVIGVSFQRAFDWFLDTDPAILLFSANDGLWANTAMLDPGDEQVIARRLREFFQRKVG